jgi:ATP:ADP antiporter, AAA family
VVTIFFVVTLPILGILGHRGVPIAFVFFIWVGIFGVMVIAQMWAFAADSFNVKSGQRLFVVIMLGANLGALFGAKLTGLTVRSLGTLGLILLATAMIATTLFLAKPERERVPQGSRPADEPRVVRGPPRLLGGIDLVMRDRYLLLIAVFVVLLNWINSTGEFILADFIKSHAEARAALPGGGDKELYIAAFRGNFDFWVTLISLAIQLFLVSRIYQAVGVTGALLVHPVIVTLGYGLLVAAPVLGGFIPIFSLIRRIKVADNGVDYSLMNTTRQTLFLPVDRETKYEGKMTIDTFFVRFGDLIQAGGIFVGLHLLGWVPYEFAILNLLLSLAWIGLAVAMGRAYSSKVDQVASNAAPEAVNPIPDLHCAPGRPFRHELSPDTFQDPDPGDVLIYKAVCDDGKPLPRWLHFDVWRQTFTGTLPAEVELDELRVAVIASDMDGLKARSTFTVRLQPD